MSTWIDFKELRSKLDFEQVLRHYGVEVKRKGNQHIGFCPLPNHQGNKNSPSFSANLERGIFHCFGCKAKGNVLDFAALMEKSDPKDGAALRQAAITLQKQFSVELGDAPEATTIAKKKPTEIEPANSPAIINAPLDFELKGLQVEHPYLTQRGFAKDTLLHFGLGFCQRGSLKDRIAIPLHDQKGRLVGYAGRLVDDSAINEDNPKYRFPGTRKREEKVYEFRKTRFLYNGFRIQRPVDDLIVVEGFPSVWWLFQHGVLPVVSTMGSDLSEKQTELIVASTSPAGRVWLMPDADAAGERFVASLLREVSPHRFVRWVKLESDKQPTDYEGNRLRALLNL